MGYVIIAFLLYSISFVNIEKIVNFDFTDFFVVIFFLYFISAVFLTVLSKIKKEYFSQEEKYTIQFVLFFCILLIPGIIMNHNFLLDNIMGENLYLRVYGRIAFLYFTLALLMSPLASFISHPIWKQHLIFSRKILGILSFIFFLKHGLEYFSMEYIFQTQYHLDVPYFNYVYNNLFIRYDAISGVIVWGIMLVLGLSSNKFSQSFLGGKKWKKLQSLVFPAFLISVVHIAFASRFSGFYISLLIIVVTIRLIAYLTKTETMSSGKIIGYRCIPCGYIYNEKFGDPDSWIAPGTKFEDIPDTWRCPICGVWKEDFEAIYEGEELFFDAKIYGYNMLTEDVLELQIQVLDAENVEVLAGQFANIVMQDQEGEFTRSYSIVRQEKNILTFAIKLKKWGRWWEFLRKVKVWGSVKFAGVHGEFILKKTENPKVFIATGTWLSPLMNMMFQNSYSRENYLFFWVQKEKDLFYLTALEFIPFLKKYIYLSREEKSWYKTGRIDISQYDFPQNTEFYICGNPWLVEGTKKYLYSKSYKNIYFEIF